MVLVVGGPVRLNAMYKDDAGSSESETSLINALSLSLSLSNA